MNVGDQPGKWTYSKKTWISFALVLTILCVGVALFLVVRQFQNPKHRMGVGINWNLQINEPIRPTKGDPSVHTTPEAAFLYNGVVEAELTRIFPDTYTQPTEILGGDLWHIVQMKTRDVLAGENMPEEFYLMLPKGYSDGLAKYDSFLLAVSQKSIVDYTLVNTDQCRYEHFYPLLEIADGAGKMDKVFNTVYNKIDAFCVLAFSDGYLDTSLWQADMWDDTAWETVLAADSEYPVKVGHSLEEAKQGILDFRKKNSQYIKPEYGRFYTLDDYTTEEVSSLAERVASFENGVFAYNRHGPGGVGEYHRLVNGLPTNEYYVLNADGNVEESGVTFTDADIAALPELSSFIQSTTAENPDWYQETWIVEVRAGYYKDGDNVFGYIRVVWNDKYTTAATKNLIVHPDGQVEDLTLYQWNEYLNWRES